MIYRKLTESGDYMLGRRNQFHKGAAAVAQAIKTRLGQLRGEWWENTEDGLPLYQEIANTLHATDHRAEIIDLIFTERILNTPGAESIASFESELNAYNRAYSALCVVLTDDGGQITLQIKGNGNGPFAISI
jgi:hypothetical protein